MKIKTFKMADAQEHRCSKCEKRFFTEPNTRIGNGWFPYDMCCTAVWTAPCSTWRIDGVLCPDCYKKQDATPSAPAEDGIAVEKMPPLPARSTPWC